MPPRQADNVHGPPGLPRWAGFFLSVAGYVVKPGMQKFKCENKCQLQKEIRRFQQKTADFVELLSRFELETSSLPTDSKPSEHRFPALWGPFCSKKAETTVLSTPLLPPARFAVWVMVWVNFIYLLLYKA